MPAFLLLAAIELLTMVALQPSCLTDRLLNDYELL